MNRMQVFGAGIVALSIVGLCYGLVQFDRELEDRLVREHREERVLQCKAEQYDTYQYMVSIGLLRWEEACFKHGGSVERCTYPLKDCR